MFDKFIDELKIKNDKERQIKELKFKEQEAALVKQQLEAERKAREIERLSMAKKLQDVMLKENQKELSKTTTALTETQKEGVIKEKEIGRHLIRCY